jgi:CheY-like chemotaxis protein
MDRFRCERKRARHARSIAAARRRVKQDQRFAPRCGPANRFRRQSARRAGQSERLLIVDDDADVREFITTFLSDLGYEVSEAAGGEDALTVLADFKPDMIIVDFAMQGTSGAETALVAGQRCPGISILFISSFADSEELRSAVGTAPLLRKPFQPAELAAAVRSNLDARSAPAQ